jgi:hypothetical protein
VTLRKDDTGRTGTIENAKIVQLEALPKSIKYIDENRFIVCNIKRSFVLYKILKKARLEGDFKHVNDTDTIIKRYLLENYKFTCKLLKEAGCYNDFRSLYYERMRNKLQGLGGKSPSKASRKTLFEVNNEIIKRMDQWRLKFLKLQAELGGIGRVNGLIALKDITGEENGF